MKSKWLTLSLGLLLSQSVMAQGMPEACPTIDALQGTTFEQAEKSQMGWVAWVNGSFSTADNWTFAMLTQAQDADSAIEEANGNVELLSMNQGPMPNQNMWVCVYTSSDRKVMAATFTPAIGNNVSAMRTVFAK